MSRKSKRDAGGGTMRSIPEMVTQLRKISGDLRGAVKDSIEAELFNDAANYIEGATDSLREHMAEVNRLRAIIRVNIIRLSPGTSHPDIDEMIYGNKKAE